MLAINTEAAEMQKRIRVGEEILVYNLQIRNQATHPRRLLNFVTENGRSSVKEEVRPFINSRGEPFLDQVHDYYLAVPKSPSVILIQKLGTLPWIQFDTAGYSKRRATYEFGQELSDSIKTLVVPNTSQLAAVGELEIKKWMAGSALYQEIYRQLKSQLSLISQDNLSN